MPRQTEGGNINALTGQNGVQHLKARMQQRQCGLQQQRQQHDANDMRTRA
ncbi:hypothetical protein [Reyranella sp. CPCC 100927]|nr:hypothetical protein [Reyranella sp. CPCC 100927]